MSTVDSKKNCLYVSRTYRATVAALIAAAVVGCGDKSEGELISSAKRYLEKGDRQAAIVELKSAIQKNPKSASARLLFGDTLLSSGAATAAVVELEKARELKSDDAAVTPLLAKALLASGQAGKVVDRYANMPLAEPAALAALKTTLALAYFELGARADSEAAVDSALQLNPKNSVARLHKARLIGLRFDVDQALALVAAVLNDEPKNLQALQLRGDLLLGGKQDADGAARSFREALAANEKYVSAHVALIALAQRQNDSKAFRQLVAALKKALPGTPYARYYDAQIALADGDLAKARELVQELMRNAPTNPQLLLLAGTIELRNGSFAVAEGHLGKAQQLLPESSIVRQTLAQTYLRMGQGAKALVVLSPLLEQQRPEINTLTLAAQAQLQTGDKPAADALFAQAVKANPDDPDLQAALALSRIYKGDVDAGFKQLESLAAKDPGVASDIGLINARLRANDLPSALKAIERLSEKAPTRPLPYYFRGRVLLQQNDLAGARIAFEKALDVDSRHYPSAAGLASIDFAEKKPDMARKRFEALLTRDPKNARALIGVVELRQRSGAPPQEIEALLSNGIKLNPAEPLLRLQLVTHHLTTQNPQAALAAAQEAVVAVPGDMRVLDMLGEVQLAVGESQQAVSTLAKAAVAQPRNAEPLIRLAYAYSRVKDNIAAVKALRRALEISPQLLQAQRGLVQIALSERRFDDAAAVAREVQKQQPTLAIGYVLESEVRAKEQKWDAAIAAAIAAFDRGKTTGNAVRLYVLYRAAGRSAAADRLAVDWERKQPDDAGFQYELGSMALADRNYGEAESRFRKVLTLQPNDAIALNNVAWALSQQRKSGASSFAQRAQKLLPDSVAIVDTLASALAGENRLKDAIEWQRKSVTMAPNGAYYRLKLAKLLVEIGNKAEAKSELERLASLGSRFPGQTEVSRMLKEL